MDFPEITTAVAHASSPYTHDLPDVGLVRQRLEIPVVGDLEPEVRASVEKVIAASGRKPQPVAVGVGSRGIDGLEVIVRTVVGTLAAGGFEPFIVPAMGSHGGATAEGQAAILASYGIDEARVGVPVRATMDTEVIGEVSGVPVYMDRLAVEAGLAFLVCRIKPHTDFRGPIESGPSKMTTIGLGKQRGAETTHAAGTRGLRDVIPQATRVARERGLLLGALAVLENQDGETAEIHGLVADDIAGAVEAKLLRRAADLLPRIPFDQLDVLIVDEMGKNVSGTGLDTNVIGRIRVPGVEEPERPMITCIVVLRLTPDSHGNAIGIGLADFAPARLAASIDVNATYANCLTAGSSGINRGKLPIFMPDDRSAIRAAISACGRLRSEPLRLAWIKSTLHAEMLGVNESLYSQVTYMGGVERVRAPAPVIFDGDGRACTPWWS